MLIGLDFDRTLTTGGDDPYRVGGEEPNWSVVQLARRLKEEKNYDIVIWTARPWSHAQHIAGLCIMWGIPFNGVMCQKGGADAYIDDRAVNSLGTDLEATLEALLEPNQETADNLGVSAAD